MKLNGWFPKAVALAKIWSLLQQKSIFSSRLRIIRPMKSPKRNRSNFQSQFVILCTQSYELIQKLCQMDILSRLWVWPKFGKFGKKLHFFISPTCNRCHKKKKMQIIKIPDPVRNSLDTVLRDNQNIVSNGICIKALGLAKVCNFVKK